MHGFILCNCFNSSVYMYSRYGNFPPRKPHWSTCAHCRTPLQEFLSEDSHLVQGRTPPQEQFTSCDPKIDQCQLENSFIDEVSLFQDETILRRFLAPQGPRGILNRPSPRLSWCLIISPLPLSSNSESGSSVTLSSDYVLLTEDQKMFPQLHAVSL